MTLVSPREAEVLELVGEGLPNAEIGRRLFISVRTVESHVSALLRKLELPDRHALARDGAGRTVGPAALRGAPEPLTSFVGRRADLEAVLGAMSAGRLVTLTGPGGVGKTRLAIEAGRARDAHAKWFVDLVPAGPNELVRTIATALGVAERPDLTLEEVIHATLRSGRTLLLLDNCEHLLDAAGPVVEGLLHACPELGLLATSREPIGLPGERVVPVSPLAIEAGDDDAIALFVARATAAGLASDDIDRDVVAEICTRLDGMPLSIELAAARAGVLGTDGLLTALGDTLRVLSGARRVDERHRSLRAVLDWSYELLDDDERTVLRRVSVFHGGFRLADATALVGDELAPPAVADVVGRLAAKSLVAQRPGDRAGGFRLLETIRVYGNEKLTDAGEAERARDLHAEWAFAEAADLERDVEATDVADPRIDDVLDDLRAALTWSGTRAREKAHALAHRIAHLVYARRFVSMAARAYEEAAAYAASDAEAALDLIDAGYAAAAIGRGDLAYDAWLSAARRAELGGAPERAALALALATEFGSRFAGEFGDSPPRVDLDAHLARACALGDGGDPLIAARIAMAKAWLSTEGIVRCAEPTALAASAAADATGDAVLRSGALDAVWAATFNAGRLREAIRLTDARMSLLDAMARHDPRAGAEQFDVLHMATSGPLNGGDLPLALRRAHQFIDHPLVTGTMPMVRAGLTVALCMTGRFDEATSEAELMRAAWERNGEPAANWLAPVVHLTALVHGLRQDDEGYERYAKMAAKACPSATNPVLAFSQMRLALHEGRFDDARTAIEDFIEGQPRTSSRPWSVTACAYESYLWSLAAETWALVGERDVDERIACIREAYREQPWSVACLDRAVARLQGDDDLLRRAAIGFAAIDARFEEAATLALLDGVDGDEARTALTGLGVSPPAR